MQFESVLNTVQCLLLKQNRSHLTSLASLSSRESVAKLATSNYPQETPRDFPEEADGHG